MATCCYCKQACGEDVPGAVVFHLACGAARNAATQAVAMEMAGMRADPNGLEELHSSIARAKAVPLSDVKWPEDN